MQGFDFKNRGFNYKRGEKKTHKNPPCSFFMDEMLPVCLRFNFNIVHLFLFALIPELTPKEGKEN